MVGRGGKPTWPALRLSARPRVESSLAVIRRAAAAPFIQASTRSHVPQGAAAGHGQASRAIDLIQNRKRLVGMGIGGPGAHLGRDPDRLHDLLVGGTLAAGALDMALDAPGAL